jgi:hypothetical protein
MSDRLVTVSRYSHTHEAQIARSALQAAGIDAIVVGEHTAALEQGPSDLRLQVREDDAEAADAVLNEMHGVAHAEYIRPSDAEEAAPPARCERCGSPDVRRINRIVVFGAVAALVAIVFAYIGQTLSAFYLIIVVGIFLLVSARWQCRHCGYRW